MKFRIVSLVAVGAVLTALSALAQSVTPPPLKSVNAEGLWSVTGIYVGFDGGELTGGGANFEMELGDSGKDALTLRRDGLQRIVRLRFWIRQLFE